MTRAAQAPCPRNNWTGTRRFGGADPPGGALWVRPPGRLLARAGLVNSHREGPTRARAADQGVGVKIARCPKWPPPFDTVVALFGRNFPDCRGQFASSLGLRDKFGPCTSGRSGRGRGRDFACSDPHTPRAAGVRTPWVDLHSFRKVATPGSLAAARLWTASSRFGRLIEPVPESSCGEDGTGSTAGCRRKQPTII